MAEFQAQIFDSRKVNASICYSMIQCSSLEPVTVVPGELLYMDIGRRSIDGDDHRPRMCAAGSYRGCMEIPVDLLC